MSLADSSSIFSAQDYHFDLAHSAVALYGVNPAPKALNLMAKVVRLEVKIPQIRYVDSLPSVGYGAYHVGTWPNRIANIRVVYAGGYLRSASNRASGYVRGVQAPIVGRVSMGMISLDITYILSEHAQPGELIDLINGKRPVDAPATETGTIGYKMLASFGQRYRRRYIQIDRPRGDLAL